MRPLLLSLFIACTTLAFSQSYLLVGDKVLSNPELNYINSAQSEFELQSLSRVRPYYEVISALSTDILKTELINLTGLRTLTPSLEVDYRETFPNDNLFFDQWSMERIGATKVWDVTTGGTIAESQEDIVIAVLDDGYLVEHEDLIDNIWVNADEIPGDGIDNDNNGYIDDYQGYNAQSDNDQHSVSSHGSRTAGIVGAKGNNNIGITGVNWDVKIMLLSGITNAPRIVEGYEYIIAQKQEYIASGGQRGANVIVTSFSGGIANVSESDYPEWCELYNTLGELGILSVSAAPNLNIDLNQELDLPTRCSSDYLIVATNSDQLDRKVVEAGYSSQHVDIAAPGEEIPSTNSTGSYKNISGTSASCPHIAGGIGLLYSLNCDIFEIISNKATLALSVKDAVMESARSAPDLQGITVSGGILDLAEATNEIRSLCGLTNEDIGITTLDVSSFTSPASPVEFVDVEFTTIHAQEVEIALYDMRGRLLVKNTIVPDIFNPNRVTLSTGNDLIQGMYIVTLSNGEHHLSRKFVVSAPH